MKKIIFCCQWAYDKENSWSGTNMAVRKRLNQYFDVLDFDYGVRQPYAFFSKINDKIFKNKIDTFNHYNNQFKKKYGDGNVVFQFGDLPNYEGNIRFVYQDLTMGYIRYLCNNNKFVFEHSSFQHLPKNEIDILAERQDILYTQKDVHFFTMSHWLAKWLVDDYKLPKEKVDFVGGGINIDVSKIDFSKKTGNKFLFVGKDFERKNGPLVVEAFKKILIKDKKYELYIAGPNSIDVDLDNIHFLGNLSFDDLVPYFNMCDVFVMPSIFEAYGLVFPEALSFGLPCIGRDAFEMPYFIKNGENGYLLKNNSVDELSELMLKAITNHQMKKFVIEHASDYFEQYSWDTTVKKIADIINENIH